MAEATDSLNQVPLFAGLGRKELKKLGQQMSERTFPEGQAITEEGEGGIGFFVIEHGSATVSIGGEVIRTLGPGDWFGEIALIDEGKRTATIVAGTDLRCQGMTAWEFRALRPGPSRGRLAAAADPRRAAARIRSAAPLVGPGQPTRSAKTIVK